MKSKRWMAVVLGLSTGIHVSVLLPVAPWWAAASLAVLPLWWTWWAVLCGALGDAPLPGWWRR